MHVDDDHRVGHGIEDRLEVGFAFAEVRQGVGGAVDLAAQAPAPIGDGAAEERKERGVYDVRRVRQQGRAADQYARHECRHGRDQGRAGSPQGGRQQDRRHEQQEEWAVFEDGRHGVAGGDRDAGDGQCSSIAQPDGR